MDRGQSLQHKLIHLQIWPKLKAGYFREDFNNILIRKRCFLTGVAQINPHPPYNPQFGELVQFFLLIIHNLS